MAKFQRLLSLFTLSMLYVSLSVNASDSLVARGEHERPEGHPPGEQHHEGQYHPQGQYHQQGTQHYDEHYQQEHRNVNPVNVYPQGGGGGGNGPTYVVPQEPDLYNQELQNQPMNAPH